MDKHNSSKAEYAVDLFHRGANCAQAVAGAFAAEVGISETELFKIAGGFGGGVGRMREVCGAVSGMVLIMNMIYGTGDITDKNAKDEHYARIQKLVKRFEAETGSIVCRTLLGLDKNAPTPPQSEARTETYYHKRPCADMVALATALLAEYLQFDAHCSETGNTPEA